MYSTMYVLAINIKNIKILLVKFSIFTAEKNSVYCMGMFSFFIHFEKLASNIAI